MTARHRRVVEADVGGQRAADPGPLPADGHDDDAGRPARTRGSARARRGPRAPPRSHAGGSGLDGRARRRLPRPRRNPAACRWSGRHRRIVGPSRQLPPWVRPTPPLRKHKLRGWGRDPNWVTSCSGRAGRALAPNSGRHAPRSRFSNPSGPRALVRAFEHAARWPAAASGCEHCHRTPLVGETSTSTASGWSASCAGRCGARRPRARGRALRRARLHGQAARSRRLTPADYSPRPPWTPSPRTS